MYTKNSSVGHHDVSTLAYLFTAGAAGLLLSCSSPKADNAAGSGVSEPNAPNAPAEVIPIPAESTPNAPVTEIPTPAADSPATESMAPSAETAQATESMEERVAPLVSSVSGTKLLFTACEADPCVARVQATELSALHQVLTALSQEFSGNIAFSAREQLDAYTGHSFQADVLLDVTEGSRVVPGSQDDLLTPP